MAWAWTGYQIGGVILLIIGILLIIAGVVLLAVDQNRTRTTTTWWVWGLLIVGFIIGIIGLALLFIPTTPTVVTPAVVPGQALTIEQFRKLCCPGMMAEAPVMAAAPAPVVTSTRSVMMDGKHYILGSEGQLIPCA